MIEPLNTEIDMITDGTSFLNMADYGSIIIGNQGFEFYDEKNIRNFIQIPWSEIDFVVASVLFKGKWIPRFSIETKRSGDFIFAAKDTKQVLRGMQKYISSEQMVQSLSFWQVIRQGLQSMFKR
ncbi:DUF956 family protein [Aerococcaceae bacterium DSM 111020]|nr:DUF956 family protein [Aerococcaceae bacterium DSM 111020]